MDDETRVDEIPWQGYYFSNRSARSAAPWAGFEGPDKTVSENRSEPHDSGLVQVFESVSSLIFRRAPLAFSPIRAGEQN
jgi:hypothetical protein